MVAFFWRGNNFLCTISIISRLIYTIPNKINKKESFIKSKDIYKQLFTRKTRKKTYRKLVQNLVLNTLISNV